MSKPERNLEPVPNAVQNLIQYVASARLQSTIQWPVAGLNVTDHLLDSNRLSIELAGPNLMLRTPTGETALVPMTNVKFLVLK